MGRERGLRGRLVLLLAVVALVGALLPSRPAEAAVTLDPSSGPPGTQVSFSGSGAPPSTWITAYWQGTTPVGDAWSLGEIYGANQGTYSAYFQVPFGLSPSTYAVTFEYGSQWNRAGMVGSAIFTVVAGSGSVNYTCPPAAGRQFWSPDFIPCPGCGFGGNYVPAVASVQALGPNDIWAVLAGGGAVWHYNGESWQLQQGLPSVESVVGPRGALVERMRFSTARDGWAVAVPDGLGNVGGPLPGTVFHYDGVSWRAVTGALTGTVPSGQLFYATQFLDTATGYAVGNGGIIQKTADGGATWTVLNSGTSKNLFSLHFPGLTTGYAVGMAGTIIKTADRGATWTALTSGTTQNLFSVYFLSPTTGYAVGNGGTIIKTTNGGATWSPVASGTTQPLYSVQLVDSTTGFIAGYGGVILKTSDGGATWVALSSGTTQPLYRLHFPTASTGYAVGNGGTIVKSSDAGATWAVLTSGTTKQLRDVYFTSAITGFVVGDSNTILKTTDEGVTWTAVAFGPAWRTVPAGTLATIYGIHFSSPSTGHVVGQDIARTTDGGATWRKAYFTPELYHSVFPRTSTDVWLAGESAAQGGGSPRLAHWDGAIWQEAGGLPEAGRLYDVFMLSAGQGWAVGSLTYQGQPAALRYDGTSWNPAPLLDAGGPVTATAVHMLSASNGWMAADDGRLFRYDGTNWRKWAALSLTPGGAGDTAPRRLSFSFASPTEGWLGLATGWGFGARLAARWDGQSWQAVSDAGEYSVGNTTGKLDLIQMLWTGSQWLAMGYAGYGLSLSYRVTVQNISFPGIVNWGVPGNWLPVEPGAMPPNRSVDLYYNGAYQDTFRTDANGRVGIVGIWIPTTYSPSINNKVEFRSKSGTVLAMGYVNMLAFTYPPPPGVTTCSRSWATPPSPSS